MRTTIHEFEVGDRAEVSITLPTADVTVVEGGIGTIRVEAEGTEKALEPLEIFQTGDVVTVRTRNEGRNWGRRAMSVHLHVPVGVAFAARTASGDYRVLVDVSDVDFSAASGDLRLTSFNGRARLKTASGDLAIGEATGGLQVGTAAGDVRVDTFEGDAQISTASGDAVFGAASGSVSIKTASGDVTIRRFSGVRFDGATMSGDFDIGLVPGMSIDADFQTLSGSFRNLVAAGTGERSINASMRIKTLSGDIVLR
ncbi:MAG: DUF4097 family beta strand repeat-containing protein [Acidimicrobiia bacterium]